MWTVPWWRRRLYPDPSQSDAVAVAIRQVYRFVSSEARVLDIGAGAGELSVYDLRGRCGEIAGVDVNPRVESNPLLDRGVIANATGLPFDDASFDVAFSIYVLEHVEKPDDFCAEVKRVLNPGGVYVAMTPNFLHYVPLVAALTPTTFHKWFNRRRGLACEDTFATHYRMNTRRALCGAFERAGFQTVNFRSLIGSRATLFDDVTADLPGRCCLRTGGEHD